MRRGRSRRGRDTGRRQANFGARSGHQCRSETDVSGADRSRRASRRLSCADRRGGAGLVGLHRPSRDRFRPRHPARGVCQGRAEDFGITAMSATDPSAARLGHATLTLIKLLPQAEAQNWFPGDHDGGWKAWRQSPDYQDRKKKLGDRLIAAAEKVIPGLSSHIVYRDEASPVTLHALRLVEHGFDLRRPSGGPAEGRQEPDSGSGGRGQRNAWPGHRGGPDIGGFRGGCVASRAAGEAAIEARAVHEEGRLKRSAKARPYHVRQ